MQNVLRVVDLVSGRQKFYPSDQIRKEHRWAYNHLVEHDCGCLSCGKTVYQLLPPIPIDREVPPGVNADVDGSFYEGGHDK